MMAFKSTHERLLAARLDGIRLAEAVRVRQGFAEVDLQIEDAVKARILAKSAAAERQRKESKDRILGKIKSGNLLDDLQRQVVNETRRRQLEETKRRQEAQVDAKNKRVAERVENQQKIADLILKETLARQNFLKSYLS